ACAMPAPTWWRPPRTAWPNGSATLTSSSNALAASDHRIDSGEKQRHPALSYYPRHPGLLFSLVIPGSDPGSRAGYRGLCKGTATRHEVPDRVRDDVRGGRDDAVRGLVCFLKGAENIQRF